MAATRNWAGGSHDFFAPASWTPAGRPIVGDTAIIGIGTLANPNVAAARNAVLDGITVVLDDGSGALDPTTNPTLSLTNTLITGSTVIEEKDGSFPAGRFAETIDLKEVVLNQGSIVTNTPFTTLNIDLADNTVLVNQGGTISSPLQATDLLVEGGNRTALVNNGTISGVNAHIDIGTATLGQGVFDVSENAGYDKGVAVEFHREVGDGQTISITDSIVALDAPMAFKATINDHSVGYEGNPGVLASNSSVLLRGEQATALSFLNNVLTVSNGADTLAHLTFAAGLNADDFVLTNTPLGASIDISLPSPPAALGASPPQSQA